MLKKNVSKLLLFILIGGCIFTGWPPFWNNPVFPPAVPATLALDGGSVVTVSPTLKTAGSSGNTFTFAVTTDANKDSGGMVLAVPAGWSAPQLVSGQAGYTKVTTTGLLADQKDSLDTIGNWDVTSRMVLAVDSSDRPEGSASLQNSISVDAVAGDKWYFNEPSAKNWGNANSTNGLRVGFWIKSNVALASGNLSWQDDDSADLASPLDTVAVPAVSANAWKYVSVKLAAARSSIISSGLRYTTDIGAVALKTDAFSALFDAAENKTNWGGGSTKVTVATLNTAGNFMEGAAAIRCTYSTTAGANEKCQRSSTTAVTFGPGPGMSFWIRSSIAMNAGDLQWMADDATALSSPNDTVNLPALSANTWTYVTLSAPFSANLPAKSWGLNHATAGGGFTLDIDAIGKQISSDSALNSWEAPLSAQTLSLDFIDKKEGTAALKNVISSTARAGDKWYKNLAVTQNWASYTTIGFWVKSSVNTNAGDLQFEYDNNTSLSSPIASLNLGPLPANTWSYQKLTLSGTRNSILSYGLKAKTDFGAATIWFDDLLAGPGMPAITGSGPWNINLTFLSLASAQTVAIAYGSGGGNSGVVTPAQGGDYTFTMRDRDSASGTLTAISASPVITVNAPPTLGAVSATPVLADSGDTVVFSTGNWVDQNANETVKMFVCKTNALNSPATGGCKGGTWFASPAYTDLNPQNGSYITQITDIKANPYYIFLCDSKQLSNSCSASATGTFTVQPSVSVSASGNKTAMLMIPLPNQYPGGAFNVIRNSGSTTVTQIIISEKGSVDAHNNLSNLQLFYKTEVSCESTIPANATAFNATGISFDTADQALVTGTMPVGTTNVCIYAKLNVENGALAGDTLNLTIANPSTDVLVTGGDTKRATTAVAADATGGAEISPSGQTILNGTLSVDFVDANDNSVSTPVIKFLSKFFSYKSLQSGAILGTPSQKIRVSNRTINHSWNLSIAATNGPTALWDAGTAKYDFNDDDSGVDGPDADQYGGQLSVDLSHSQVKPVSPCALVDGINGGSNQDFSEITPSISSITIFTADEGTPINCKWDLTGIGLHQIIPASQPGGTYTFSFTLTIT